MARVYEYDVFISYCRRGSVIGQWVHTHFHPRLSELLDVTVVEAVSVFTDDMVGGGQSWPERSRSALQRSRILVPVCSPKYFRDEWCLAEWHTMAEREQLSGPATLIYPVIFNDSESFPPWAGLRRMQDLRDYAQPYPQFQESPAYLGFHKEMGRIADEVADLIKLAPEWRSDWPVLTPQPGPPPIARKPRL
ncbi:TIR domain-containing protein [Actinokineospora enzanensis]|uniref:TIR domain-containing protein n=1 Tax=Actinokineospora enzanensis TaxID=155975 RepID=UPI0012EBAE95|nr:TIR domain-containing protein [Actinokineospora enzanensis]